MLHTEYSSRVPFRFKTVLLLLSLVFCLPSNAVAEKQVKIAVLALRGSTAAQAMWQATADYLTMAIPGYRFSVVPLDFRSFAPTVAQSACDFVIVNSSMYVEFESLYGVTRIATMQGQGRGRGGNLFGGVIFSRSDRSDLDCLQDLSGKRFMGVEPNSLGGWRVAWREFHQAGMAPDQVFSQLEFGGTHDRVVLAVRDGRVDAGTVRTGILEAMAAEGKIDLHEFKVINRQEQPGFLLRVSTRLYPEWPIARLRHTDDQLAAKVVVALLNMPSGHRALQQAGITGWTPPQDYREVHELFRELKLGPYAQFGNVTAAMVFARYRYQLLLLLSVIAGLAVSTLYVRRQHRQLARSKQQLEEAHTALQVAQAQMLQQEKLASIGQLAAGVAHEINNPCGFVQSNLQSLQKFTRKLHEFISLQSELLATLPASLVAPLEQHRRRLKVDFVLEDLERLIGESSDGMARISKIVCDLKIFSRPDGAERVPLAINAAVESTLTIAWNELKYKASVEQELQEELPMVVCNPGQINQVILNILVNAAQAIVDHGVITVRTWSDGAFVCLSVTDTGGGIAPEHMNRLFDPFFTTKEPGKGTGLGLSISYDIIKKHNGSITVSTETGKGSCFTVSLPC
jgi:two-component system sensor histidine kinase TtrS